MSYLSSPHQPPVIVTINIIEFAIIF